MPKAAPRPCTSPLCRSYATKGGRCDKHQPEPWKSSRAKSRHERGYGNAWDKLREVILERDGHLCQECLRNWIYTQGNHVDHITPKAEGGTDEHNNLQCLCKPCHDAKTKEESIRGRE